MPMTENTDGYASGILLNSAGDAPSLTLSGRSAMSFRYAPTAHGHRLLTCSGKATILRLRRN